jgi:Putative Actinobacterial Holin-X, holin superfamily III
MADTVDTAATSSPADQTGGPQDARSVSPENAAEGSEKEAQAPEGRQEEPGEPEGGEGQEAQAPEGRQDEAEEPEGREGQEAQAPEGRREEAEEPEAREEEPTGSEEGHEEPEKSEADEGEPEKAQADEGEPEKAQADDEEESEKSEDGPTLTELVELLGRRLSELGAAEAKLEAARNMPEVRRGARDGAGALVVVLAALTAFAFVNVAAMEGLSKVVTNWVAALLLAVVWLVIAGVLLFGVMGRTRQWLLWILVKEPPTETVEELERERDDAGKAALSTLERLGPALAIQIALAAIPEVGDVAEDVAGGVIEIGDSVLEASDEIVEVVTEQIPGGGVVNQVWSVALTPGRFGIRVATTVLRRGSSNDSKD